MKEIGIVRRIDELGRIVIPIEIRRTMRMRSGDEMEMFVENGESIILRKYSQLATVKPQVDLYTKILYEMLGECVVVTSNSSISSVCGDKYGTLSSGNLSKALINKIEERKSVVLYGEECVPIVALDRNVYTGQIVSVINVAGDTKGAVVLANCSGKKFTESEVLIIEVVSKIIAEILV